MPRAIGPGANAFMLLLGTVIIASSGVLIDTIVWVGFELWLDMGIVNLMFLGTLIGLVAVFVAKWILDMPWRAPIIAGATFTVLNVAFWTVLELVEPDIPGLYAITMVLYGVFSGALVWESQRWHQRRFRDVTFTNEIEIFQKDIMDMSWFRARVVPASVVALVSFLIVILMDLSGNVYV